ncbi:MAG TPA: hypothetical protein VH329_00530 [Solirubrobacterales bacterium]|jgi:hypothetical protein
MYARVVRFTDVDPDRIAAIQQRIEENDGPPEGVISTGMKLLFDESQGTAVFVGFFDTEENMRESGEVLEAMDPEETPGTRASIDLCEVKVEADA